MEVAVAVVAEAAAAGVGDKVMRYPTKVGLAWRPELSRLIGKMDIEFTEVLAESICEDEKLPEPLLNLQARNVEIIPHGVSLSLGGARKPDERRLDRLARLATQLKAPYISEHFAFVRAGKLESGHLLPFKRNELMLELLVENIQYAQERLPVPLCLENIASLFDWEKQEISEPDFISAIVRETGVGLLLDVSNLYANSVNLKFNFCEYLDKLPLDRVKYVHIAGGCMIDDLYHDTHAHSIESGPLVVLGELCRRICPPAVILERDDKFTTEADLIKELELVKQVVERTWSPKVYAMQLKASKKTC